ncbi:IS110 family transposase [Devosia sp. RR2S18]|uniref:IS110 family transposase n=1 Tax=Devosia rhizosphaerae TaxID=3049774 RepID=UPI0025425848|nr:IS110 family transposase [Devosia sp. RR2S18]WIJ24049.1 IS110 family transposase [Devosia sp. RR2S18]WIJ24995.1 IS110 family transposase [Devosia sp. RR2S18]WIJ26884.1 IS110 family transposase [Devosia sp. RR2S18]
MDQIYIGVDVAKAWLDIYHPAHGARRIENTPAGIRSFASAVAREGAWVIFEASGGYDRALRDGLEAGKSSFSRVNPRQARDFARAMGVIGKTDRVDARMLATFGQKLQPAQTPPISATRQVLLAQIIRRRQLVEMRKQEATRLQQTTDSDSRSDMKSLILVLERRIAKVEARIAEIIQSSPEIAETDRMLQSVPGVGMIVSATLMAELPEIGTTDRRKIAALAGLAPIARDSGQRQGKRVIGGGRATVRTVLYLAALHASRHSTTFKAFRRKLQDAGKPVKAALTATARKLLSVLNSMVADGAYFREILAT